MGAPRVIITTGPASEPVDAVRRLTNTATGEIGSLLAAEVLRQGSDPLVLRGEGATAAWPADIPFASFLGNADLAVRLQAEAAHGTAVLAVFHAAALADYRVEGIYDEAGGLLPVAAKLDGHHPRLDLRLRPALRVLPMLRTLFPRAWIVAWKYEMDGDRAAAVAAARRQLETGFCDATIVNGAAYGSGFGFVEPSGPLRHFPGKREVASFLARQLSSRRAA